MLRDVNTHVSDGLMGFTTATGDGVHIKIGASPIEAGTSILITGDMDADKIKARLGLSPLADAAMDAVQSGAAKIYCIPVAAATAGTVDEVSKTGKGGGTLTVTGSPNNAFSVIAKITASGELNTAAFAVSIDGGYRFSDEITIPLTGDYELTGTGLTLHFAEKTDEVYLNSFTVDDTFSFTTTAPIMTNGDVLAAVDKLKQFNQEFEFIHVVGESTLPLWLALSEAQKELLTIYHKPAFVLEYDGLSDIYVYHTKMLCPEGSDYRYAEDVRVRNKIIREVRKKGLLLKNDDIDLEDIQGELEARAKFVSIPLDRMVE